MCFICAVCFVFVVVCALCIIRNAEYPSYVNLLCRVCSGLSVFLQLWGPDGTTFLQLFLSSSEEGRTPECMNELLFLGQQLLGFS